MFSFLPESEEFIGVHSPLNIQKQSPIFHQKLELMNKSIFKVNNLPRKNIEDN